MKTSVEHINGKQRTVSRKPFDAEWVREQLAIGNVVIGEGESGGWSPIVEINKRKNTLIHIVGQQRGYPTGFKENIKHFPYTVTFLPPLPRNPTPSDAWLLHLYAAHGIDVVFEDNIMSSSSMSRHWHQYGKITHAINAKTGDRCEVAIIEGGE